jgi:hypothetical protein
MICGRCHREGEHKARGLCLNCYRVATRHGDLDQYPRTQWPDEGTALCCDCQTPDRTVSISGECGLCRRRYYSPEEIETWRERLRA